MTYCLALRLDEGLVFLADTRTNAGIDDISTYRKQHVLRPAADRVFVLESAGSLATTHEVLDRIQRDLETPGEHESLATVERLFDAALYIGRIGHEVSQSHREELAAVGADGTATFILGGQIGDAPPDILLVYPEGNCIRASEDRPFLQIGESKYGKFMLEVAVTADVDLGDAVKIALGSMMSTARANLSVGPPYDVGIYRTGSHHVDEIRIEADSQVLAELRAMWERLLTEAVSELPHVTREELTGTV
jgi:putative proteasome-type protease